MKKRRQAKILEIISNNEVETQEELQAYLRENDFEVTQATISRDIKELRLIKLHTNDGRYIYHTGKKNHSDNMNRAQSIFQDSIIRVQYAMNTVCIKCYSGMANAVCVAIDTMAWDGVVGTLAGDDTIFVLCNSETEARDFSDSLELLLNA